MKKLDAKWAEDVVHYNSYIVLWTAGWGRWQTPERQNCLKQSCWRCPAPWNHRYQMHSCVKTFYNEFLERHIWKGFPLLWNHSWYGTILKTIVDPKLLPKDVSKVPIILHCHTIVFWGIPSNCLALISFSWGVRSFTSSKLSFSSTMTHRSRIRILSWSNFSDRICKRILFPSIMSDRISSSFNYCFITCLLSLFWCSKPGLLLLSFISPVLIFWMTVHTVYLHMQISSLQWGEPHLKFPSPSIVVPGIPSSPLSTVSILRRLHQSPAHVHHSKNPLHVKDLGVLYRLINWCALGVECRYITMCSNKL